MKRWIFLGAMIAVGVIACVVLNSTNDPPSGPLKIIPATNTADIYHGAFTENGLEEDKVSLANIRDYENLAKKNVAWVYFSDHWFGGHIVFPSANVQAIIEAGSTPYIRMCPWSDWHLNEADPDVNMQKILDGKFDDQIKVWAEQARDTKVPLMIEFGPEVNGSWFPWNGSWNGGGTTDQYGDPNWPDGPERFRDAYRHVIDIFRSVGANNVTWILHFDVDPDVTQSWNDPKYYYPGDSYIDWIGLTVYGPQEPGEDWESFQSKLSNFYPRLSRVTKKKPYLVAEWGAIEDPQDPMRKANWIRAALKVLSSNMFPNIRGASYWHSIGWLPNNENNFRIDSSPQSLKAFQEGIDRRIWISTLRLSQ